MFDTEPKPSQPDTTPLVVILVTLISVNLHGLIWVFQPVLPVAKPKSNQRTVKLIELTPQEMRRLPEFSRPVAAFPTQPLVRPNTLPSLPPPPAKSNIPLPQPPSRPRIQKPIAQSTPQSTPTPTGTVSFQDSLSKFNAGYNPSGTTEEEAREKLSAWLKKTRRYSSTFVPRPPIPYTMRPPSGEKLPDVTPASIAVLVDPKGKTVGEPELIRSTGYSKVDRAALEDIKKRSFPATGEYVVYQYRVEMEQNNQPSQSTTDSSSTSSESKTPTPQPYTFPRPQGRN